MKTKTHQEPTQGTGRRHLLAQGLMALAGLLIGKKALAAEAPPTLETSGELLKSHVIKGRPPVEPLDTMMLFERSDNNNDRAMTHEVMSLIHEEKGAKSYPWTIYAHLTTHHTEGDACVLCSRLTKEGPGWSCGLHSEVFNNARAVCLGANIETTNNYKDTTESLVIGLNIQSLGPYDCQYGIQVHGDRGSFQKAIGLNNTKGEVGLDIGGNYNVGIHTHKNNIRLDEGSSIELDGVGKVRMRYAKGRIEFLNGDKCIGHILTDGDDHAL